MTPGQFKYAISVHALMRALALLAGHGPRVWITGLLLESVDATYLDCRFDDEIGS